jgi:hypothetical protein
MTVPITTPITDLDDINSNWDNTAFANGIFESDEVYIDADNKSFYFKNGGNFASAGSGVTGQALYSFFKDRWKNDQYLPQYEFPMLSITNEQFEFINGWKIDDTQTVAQSGGFNATSRKMIRTAGWSEVEVDGTVSRRYFGFVSLGELGTTDQLYFVQDDSFEATPADTAYTDAVNEAIQFYGNIDTAAGGDTAADDFVGEALVTGITGASIVVSTKTVTSSSHGLVAGDVIKVSSATDADIDGFYIIDSADTNTFVIRDALPSGASDVSDLVVDQVGFDRSTYYKAFVRTRGKTYADADLADIGVTSGTTYIVYRFPITNSDDLNINTTDDAAFTGASISSITGDGTTATLTASAAHGLYVGAPITIAGGTSYNGNHVVIAISGTTDAEEVLTFASTTTTSDGAGGTVALRYTDTMDVTYLPNPDSNSGDVVIKGDWVTGTTFDLGDVVFDVGNSSGAADGARWYYLDATTGDSTGANLAADTNNTWVEWTPGQRDIEENGTYSAYSVVYDLNNGGTTPGATKEVAYEYAQYLLRLTTDINAGANTNRRGDIADPLVFFVGSTLNTYSDTSIPSAVVLDDIADSDVNNVQYNEATAVTGRTNRIHLAPTVVQVTINFNNNLFNDTDAIFYAYYTTGTDTGSGTRDFGSPRALELQKVSGGIANTVGSDVNNNVPDNGTYSFNYAYTADDTNGRTTGDNAADVNITIVALGLNTGQYVTTAGDITATGATFSLVAPLERNYTNPA